MRDRRFTHIFGLISLLCLALSGCRTQKQIQYVPIESSYNSIEKDSLTQLIQTLLEHNITTKENERISIKETNTYTLNENGDTVKIIIEKETDSSKEIQTLEKYYLAIIDSISKTKVRVDSIDRPIPYPVTEYVEVNLLYWWQKALMWIGGIGIIGMIVYIGWLRIFRHKRYS